LTPDDHAATAEGAADQDARSTLVRLVHEREVANAKLSPADAAIRMVQGGFPDTRLVEIRPEPGNRKE
jgi:hypothetical protein